MIELRQVVKRYGEVTAVRGIDLHVERGELLVLIGPSGCGKTTTLKMINRLIEPTSGTILVGGQDTATVDRQALRRGIGYVIQSVGLFPHMTVQQNIQVVPNLLGWPKHRSARRADELLELVGLPPERFRHSYPKELSGGQAQRVGVARALAVDPPVLLMDEPFGAVDPLTRERLQDEFLRLQQTLKKTVVMVTHDLDEAIKLADRICVMNNGLIEQVATPEELLSAPKGRFVRQFVGSDRALKRLSRVAVRELLAPIATLPLQADTGEVKALLAQHHTVYLTEGGRLAGWVTRRALAQDPDLRSAYTPVEAGYGVLASDDAKEALSRMLAQGVSELPVVSATGEPEGCVRLQDIVALTAATDEGPG